MGPEDVIQDVVEGAAKAQREADDIAMPVRRIIYTQGLNIRDRFAMAALTGLLAGKYPPPTMFKAATEAYRLADLMLEERNRGQEAAGGIGGSVAGVGLAGEVGTRPESPAGGETAVQEQAWPQNRRGSPEHD